MTKISIPKQRSYFLASPNERDRLLCWIPPEEYEQMVQGGQIPQRVVDDYPLGLELEVSREDFDEFQLDLGVSPEAIKLALLQALERGEVQPDETVLGTDLESKAREAEQGSAKGITDLLAEATPEPQKKLAEPEMTEGEDAMSVLSGL